MNSVRRLLGEIYNVDRVGGHAFAVGYLAAVAAALPAVVRSGSLHCVDDRFARSSKWFSARVLSTSVEVPASAISLVREIFGRQCYFPTPAFVPRPDETVVDLGANRGIFTALSIRLGGKVRAVEAQHGYMRELREIMERNRGSGDIIWGLIGAARGDFANPAILESSDHFDGALRRLFRSSNYLRV